MSPKHASNVTNPIASPANCKRSAAPQILLTWLTWLSRTNRVPAYPSSSGASSHSIASSSSVASSMPRSFQEIRRQLIYGCASSKTFKNTMFPTTQGECCPTVSGNIITYYILTFRYYLYCHESSIHSNRFHCKIDRFPSSINIQSSTDLIPCIWFGSKILGEGSTVDGLKWSSMSPRA